MKKKVSPIKGLGVKLAKKAIKKAEKEYKEKEVNKEIELENRVYNILRKAAKGIGKIGKLKYSAIMPISSKDADKAKQVANLLIKRVYAIEILLREFIEKTNQRSG